jgi:hypothetical protein
MPRPSKSAAAIEKEIKALSAALAEARRVEREKAAKALAARKVIVGGWVLSQFGDGKKIDLAKVPAVLRASLDKAISREEDRVALGLRPKVSTPPPVKPTEPVKK